MKVRSFCLIGLLAALSSTAWAVGRERADKPVPPNLQPADAICVGSVDLNASAVPGGLIWTVSFTNQRKEPCRLLALDFPETSLSADGSPVASGLPGVLTPVAFQPDMNPTTIQEGADVCALVDAQDDEGHVTGTYLHCDDVEVAGESTRVISVWAAALREPPFRYCLTGTAKRGVDEVVRSVPYTFGECVDVYGVDQPPTGLVVAGPIVTTADDGTVSAQWIGGNYSQSALGRSQVVLDMPEGYAGRPTSRSNWSCQASNSEGKATCVSGELATGPFATIDFALTPIP